MTMLHVVVPSPDEPGRFCVCSVGPAGVLTAVEDCCTLAGAERRALERDRGQVEVHLPAPRRHRTPAGFYTDADAA